MMDPSIEERERGASDRELSVGRCTERRADDDGTGKYEKRERERHELFYSSCPVFA